MYLFLALLNNWGKSIMERTFKLTEKKILIYAAGGVGRTAYTNLLEMGLDIYGFVDIRAELIKYAMEKPVMSINQLQELDDKDAFLIIITLRNVFEHNRVANMLLLQGFSNLIFKPISILRGDYSDKRIMTISDAHDAILIHKEIPEYSIKKTNFSILSCFHNDALISKNDYYVKVYIPSELLYTNYSDNEKWSRVNFLSSFAAVDLYREMNRNDYECYEAVFEHYINELAYYGASTGGLNTEGEWKQIVCNTRIAVYEEMRKTMALNPNFFINNCTKVRFDKRMRFELIASGKNRVSFLIAQGFRYIPVEMIKEDFEEYQNENILNEVHAFLASKGNPMIFAPIPHPLFYNYSFGVVAGNYCDVWLGKVSKEVSNIVFAKQQNFDFSRWKIYDDLEDDGCSSRFFRALGFSVFRERNENNELESILDKLFGFETDEFLERSNYRFDFGMVMVHNDYKELSSKLLNIRSICFVLTDCDVSGLVNIFSMNGFSLEKHLFCCIWNGCVNNGLIMKRNDIK